MKASNAGKYVILAPHVDDEVIGGFRLLEARQVSDVYYFYELTEERRLEAMHCAKKFGFVPHFQEKVAVAEDKVVLLPSVRDSHPHHKEVSLMGFVLPNAKLYYSVDMARRDLLNEYMQQRKREALLELFPSQVALFVSDDRYHLFEDVSKSDVETTIKVKTRFEGIHSWPDAPDEVGFLRWPHRHLFHVQVELEVYHDDREVEFLLFQREIQAFIAQRPSLGSSSCETICKDILGYVVDHYPRRNCTVDVSEDGENGSSVKYVFR